MSTDLNVNVAKEKGSQRESVPADRRWPIGNRRYGHANIQHPTANDRRRPANNTQRNDSKTQKNTKRYKKDHSINMDMNSNAGKRLVTSSPTTRLQSGKILPGGTVKDTKTHHREFQKIMNDILKPNLDVARCGTAGRILTMFLTVKAERTSLGITTPHPQSLSPLRGEGGRNSRHAAKIVSTLFKTRFQSVEKNSDEMRPYGPVSPKQP